MTPSADISLFDFIPKWDLSGSSPALSIKNNSTGSNLAGCTYWFIASSGGGSLLFHEGTESSPDQSGAWTDFAVPEPIPVIFGHIEWSGSEFKVVGYVKDSAGIINTLTKTVRICRPNGNQTKTANNFGRGNLFVETKCEIGRVFVEDKTDYTYNGNSGMMISKLLKLTYPQDSTGATPTPSSVADANSAQFPITFSADGYSVSLAAVYEYTFSGSIVVIKYKFSEVFAIQCNVDLCALACEISKLEDQYEANGCTADERHTLALINSKMTRAIIAKMQPLCGLNLNQIVNEIKALGQFDCNCHCHEANGINPTGNGSGTISNCDDVMACVHAALNQVNPGCLLTVTQWQSMSVVAQLQFIISQATAAACAPCSAPQEVTFDRITGILRWRSTNNSYQWKIQYLRSGNTVLHDIPAPLPTYVGNGYWELDLQGMLFATGATYTFYVSAKCGNGQVSTPATFAMIPNGCTPVDFEPVTLPNAVLGVAYSQNITLTGTDPFTLGSITKPAWLNVTIVGSVLNLSGTPGAGDDGKDQLVEIIVNNGCGTTTINTTMSVEASCVVPTFTMPDIPSAQVGQPFLLNVALNGTGPFYLTAGGHPSWLTISIVGSTLVLSGTPDASDVGTGLGIKLKVSNDCGSQNASVFIDVHPATCVNVTFTDPHLGDALVGAGYAVNIALSGTAPFNLTGVVKPSWMNIAIVGSVVAITGTPGSTDTGTGIAVEFVVNNACGNQTLLQTIDVTDRCVEVAFTPPTLPDALQNEPYTVNVPLSGTMPFNLTGVTKPDWMNIAIVGSQLQFTGTPDDTDITSAIPIAFTVNNACGTQSFSQDIAVSLECQEIGLSGPSLTLPDGDTGLPYEITWTITGTGPWSLEDVTIPDWMSLDIVGNELKITGNAEVGNDQTVNFTILNSCSSLPVVNVIDVLTGVI